ncbi:Hypothetical predicted protein [Olea europaea subsp. europaea]|uniref:Uncharacterized protein n=1 Tax=Olea europaea subsp. europaea TaxID=158383 RepID=A0A8S0Q507_OLEEU|nr:Hypothetical predicted protein [Olea europaea subsp. europaea]
MVVAAMVEGMVILVLTRNAMSVVSLTILPVSAGTAEVLEGIRVILSLDIAEAQAIVEGLFTMKEMKHNMPNG